MLIVKYYVTSLESAYKNDKIRERGINMNLDKIILEQNRLFLKNDIPQEYLSDEYLGKGGTPFALVKVKTHQEVVEIAKFASENKYPMIAIGSNTGLAGATLPMGNEILIDFSLMNRIIDMDPNTMTLTVEPGVLLHEIQEYVEERNFFYPPDPGSKNSSIGGNVATNAGGMRAIKYGVTRNYVKALTVVLANGDTMELGSLNVKDSSGYDIKDLFIGSEGTLGMTTLIKLKILPLPEHKQSFVLAFDELVDATRLVPILIHAHIDPSAMEFFEREMLSLSEASTNIAFPTKKGKAFLVITLDGYELSARTEILKTLSLENKCIDFIPLDTKQLEKDVWLLRDGLLSAVVNYSEQVTMDETVPINLVSDIYEYSKELELEYKTKLMSFGHAGDGNLHTCIIRGNNKTDEEWQRVKEEILTKLYTKIKEYGGLPSAEHGIGLIKKKHFTEFMDKNYLDYMKQIKRVFDPEHLLNPHKLID